MLQRLIYRLLFLSLLIPRIGVGQSISIKPKVTTRAIVVGVSDYAEISDLDYAHRDAEAFAQFLQTETSWKVDPGNLQLLTNETATFPRFHKAMKWLLAETKPQDRAIIYFSGHGDVEESVGGRLGYLLLHSSPPVDYPLGGACPLEYLDAMIATLSKDKQSEVILITDACRSGKLAGSENGGPGLTNQSIGERFEEVIKIMSCAADQYSLEDETWGGGRGLFSYHLIHGLTGLADEDEDEQLYLYELSDYVRSKVRKESRQYGTLQIPVVCCNEEAALNTIDTKQLLALNAELSMEENVSVGIAPMRKGNLSTRPDSSFQRTLAAFRQALDRGHLMFPESRSAAAMLRQLQAFTGYDSLVGLATDDLSVALQEEAQLALNTYLKTPSKELSRRWNGAELYQHYPAYLEKAAELLGTADYFHQDLLARAAYFRGINLRLAGEKQKNEAVLRQAMDLQRIALAKSPNTAHTLNEMGYLHFLLGQREEAIHYFQQAVEAAPAWVLPYSNLAETYRRLRDYKKAEAAALKAVALDSTLVLAVNNLGLIYFLQDRDDEAKVLFDRALQLDPSYAETHYNLGNWHFWHDDPEKSAQYLKQYNAFRPNDPAGHELLGRLYLGIEKYEEGALAFAEALRLDATHRVALYNFGSLRYGQGRYADAIDLYLRYRELETEDPDVYWALLCCYALNQQYDQALANLTTLLADLEFKDLDRLQEEKDLQNLRQLPKYQDLIDQYFPK